MFSPAFHSKLRTSPRVLTAVAAVVALIAAVAIVIALGSGSGGPPPAALPALATRVGPESIFAAGAALKADPTGTLPVLARLGIDRVRLFLGWSSVAPDATATRAPAAFAASDPAAYPAAGWLVYDTIIRDALARGIGVDLVLGPPPPRWASGAGAPQPGLHTYWRPSAPDFEQFVRAVGVRYSGHYVPPGASAPLPRVGFWSIWNEPNLGVMLAPQAIHHAAVEVAPTLYRKLLDAAWTGLHATGHAHDTILIGELDPAGQRFGGGPGNFNATAPLRFVRALYCVGADYRPLRGAAAGVRGCPASAAGTARFSSLHPGLFHATAFADHPYTQGLAPDLATPGEPDFAELAAIPKLIRVLDTVQQTYGSTTRFPIYSTEFGYQTSPPDTEAGTVSQTLAARYLNWAEYITWRQPRLVSYNQYLLEDPTAGNFASGLETPTGAPKPGFYAYRMPLYLPVTATASGHPLEVWGCVRPAHYARLLSHRRQRVQIQFRPASGGAFATVQTVDLTGRYGYFDVLAKFSGSGSVRLAWSYPDGSAIFSRTVDVAVG